MAAKGKYIPQDEICVLIDRWQGDGDIEARNKVVMNFTDLARKYASKFARANGVSKDEFEATAVMGLIRTCDKYDTSSNFTFYTHAVQNIKSLINEEVRKSKGVVRLANSAAVTNVINNRGRIFDEVQREAEIKGVRLTPDQIDERCASRLRISVDLYRDICRGLNTTSQSIDTAIGHDDGNRTLADMIPGGQDPAEIFETEQYRERLRSYLESKVNRLNEREAAVIRNRFLCDPEDAQKFTDMAEEFGVSKQRVRQIFEGAIAKLAKDVRREMSPAKRKMGYIPPDDVPSLEDRIGTGEAEIKGRMDQKRRDACAHQDGIPPAELSFEDRRMITETMSELFDEIEAVVNPGGMYYGKWVSQEKQFLLNALKEEARENNPGEQPSDKPDKPEPQQLSMDI